MKPFMQTKLPFHLLRRAQWLLFDAQACIADTHMGALCTRNCNTRHVTKPQYTLTLIANFNPQPQPQMIIHPKCILKL